MNARYKLPVAIGLLVCLVAMAAPVSDAATVKKRNAGDLISMGDVILRGTVASVTDGFDANGVPYTEVTVNVDEMTRGEQGATYTFRQFGLIAPRDMGNGVTNLNVTPDGWPTYSQGEDVMLFLWKPAKWTGLRTTVGLFQGKFTVEDGMLTNVIDNEGLFDGLRVNMAELSEKEREMVKMKRGRVPVDVFASFMNKAVEKNWFPQAREE